MSEENDFDKEDIARWEAGDFIGGEKDKDYQMSMSYLRYLQNHIDELQRPIDHQREERRFQAACAVMPAIITGDALPTVEIAKQFLGIEDYVYDRDIHELTAKITMYYTDALLAELDRTKEETPNE